MKNSKEIVDLDRYLDPLLDENVKRSSFIDFLNIFCDHVESVPLLMTIIDKHEKETEVRENKIKKLEQQIAEDTDVFEEKLKKVLKQEGLFDIENPKFNEIKLIKDIKHEYIRELPYNFSSLEASMLYTFYVDKNDWLERYWQLVSAISALIENNRSNIIQSIFPDKDISKYREIISPSYKLFKKASAKINTWGVWNELTTARPLFSEYKVNKLRASAVSLKHLLSQDFDLSFDDDGIIHALPDDVEKPIVTPTSFTLKFTDGKKIEFLDRDDPSCVFFEFSMERYGQIAKHSIACTRLKIKDSPKSRTLIRGLVKTLKEKFESNKLLERMIYTPHEGQGYSLRILPGKKPLQLDN